MIELNIIFQSKKFVNKLMKVRVNIKVLICGLILGNIDQLIFMQSICFQLMMRMKCSILTSSLGLNRWCNKQQ
jgi:hypothetical protein